jgi:tRNA dimethylallyltransferase
MRGEQLAHARLRKKRGHFLKQRIRHCAVFRPGDQGCDVEHAVRSDCAHPDGASVRAVLIAGPTASGKSALALALAERTDGLIINADSMQVYRDLRIITARPTPEEEARAPHRLYGHVDAAENYTVGRWLDDVQAVLGQEPQRTAIFVGGTGLYFKLLTSGIAAVPPIPTDIRERLRARLEEEGAAALHAELRERDAVSAARLHSGDRSRILRALEVVEATGLTLPQWQTRNAAPILSRQEAVTTFLMPDKAQLNARIEARFDAMLEAGAEDEVRALATRQLDPALPAMKAHGVPWLIRRLRGETSLDEAAREAKADTRRYAKRQFTWFRNQLTDWPWDPPASALPRLLAELGKAARA